MTAYYNEIDPYAVQWLRNLIAAGHIAPGDVDDRSILDVSPDDLAGYAQCHFFAGIGVWSYALRRAGWPDERPVWTGSCPCQPFSVAGKGHGFDDQRHLWPFWFHLIAQCRPPVIIGEQVEAAIRHGWLDLVQSDLEGIDYAVGAVGLPAAGVGAPHIRQRLWFVADAKSKRFRKTGTGSGQPTQWAGDGGEPGELGIAESPGLQMRGDQDAELYRNRFDETGAVSPWADADWLPCRDCKWRPVESGTQPLAHGIAARVGRLRAYGNAIVAEVACEVIAATMACRP